MFRPAINHPISHLPGLLKCLGGPALYYLCFYDVYNTVLYSWLHKFQFNSKTNNSILYDKVQKLSFNSECIIVKTRPTGVF
ncbi:hypothetical protein C0J52_24872 [Blattella germanica]|nr:hypothetical protein C0J52_24872 [Blattella germanica]